MPVLKNAGHEKFAQARAKGATATDAYAAAGYKGDRTAASRLSTNVNVARRVAEIQGRAAERAVVTIQSLTEELEEARAIALAEKQSSAAVAATMGKAKLHGLVVEKKQHSGPNGGPIPIDLTSATDEQLAALKALFGPLAGGPGDDDEGDPG